MGEGEIGRFICRGYLTIVSSFALLQFFPSNTVFYANFPGLLIFDQIFVVFILCAGFGRVFSTKDENFFSDAMK